MGLIDRLKSTAQTISAKTEERIGRASVERPTEAERQDDQQAGDPKQGGEQSTDPNG